MTNPACSGQAWMASQITAVTPADLGPVRPQEAADRMLADAEQVFLDQLNAAPVANKPTVAAHYGDRLGALWQQMAALDPAYLAGSAARVKAWAAQNPLLGAAPFALMQHACRDMDRATVAQVEARIKRVVLGREPEGPTAPAPRRARP